MGSDNEKRDQWDRLISAVRAGNLQAVTELLRRGANPNTRDGAFPVLTLAAISGYADYPHKEMIRLLIEAGADVNVHDGAGGMTPLMRAARIGKLPSIGVLAEYGADVNATDNSGLTALTWSIRAFSDGVLWDARRTMDMLIRYGASIDVGFTPVMWIAQHGRSKYINAIASKSKQIDVRYWKARTALHLAAMNGYPGVVRKLLDLGSSPSLIDEDGNSPLGLARQRTPRFYKFEERNAPEPDYDKTVALLEKAGGS